MHGADALDWRDLELELLRPIPTAERYDWQVCWREVRTGQHVKKSPTTMTDEELYDCVTYWLRELERRAEGPMNAALLLRRFGRNDQEEESA